MEYKHILKKHHLTVKEISKLFGYSTELSFRNSSAYHRHMNGVVKLITLVEQSIKNSI